MTVIITKVDDLVLALVVDVPAEYMWVAAATGSSDSSRVATRPEDTPGSAGLPQIPVPVTVVEATGSTPNHLD